FARSRGVPLVLKALVVLGTRPEAVKLAPLVMELRRRADARAVVCATAQHREMLDQVLRIFEIAPDHDLDLMQADQRSEDVAAAAMRAVARVIDEERPDVVVVQGDTTTAMAPRLARRPVDGTSARELRRAHPRDLPRGQDPRGPTSGSRGRVSRAPEPEHPGPGARAPLRARADPPP